MPRAVSISRAIPQVPVPEWIRKEVTYGSRHAFAAITTANNDPRVRRIIYTALVALAAAISAAVVLQLLKANPKMDLTGQLAGLSGV